MSQSDEASSARVLEVLRAAKALAREYRVLTGKPLGVTGEVAEYEAASILNLKLSAAREPGFDATALIGGKPVRYQIKGRCVLDSTKNGQRVGQIRLNHPWDVVLLVLLDSNLDATAIHEADRAAVENVIRESESNAHRRGALSVRKFKSIGRVRWTRAGGAV